MLDDPNNHQPRDFYYHMILHLPKMPACIILILKTSPRLAFGHNGTIGCGNCNFLSPRMIDWLNNSFSTEFQQTLTQHTSPTIFGSSFFIPQPANIIQMTPIYLESSFHKKDSLTTSYPTKSTVWNHSLVSMQQTKCSCLQVYHIGVCCNTIFKQKYFRFMRVRRKFHFSQELIFLLSSYYNEESHESSNFHFVLQLSHCKCGCSKIMQHHFVMFTSWAISRSQFSLAEGLNNQVFSTWTEVLIMIWAKLFS